MRQRAVISNRDPSRRDEGLGRGRWRTGKAVPAPGPNFAGQYIIVTWGCGSPCLPYRSQYRPTSGESGDAERCGAHYFVMGDDVIRETLKLDRTNPRRKPHA